ncbi:Activator of Hsp90 ATPase 1 family protein [Methylobacterium sp. 4-46]|uniref:SRPBCC family protein n=1 Tax=unclassified Methylobacterium TaxID=2615210 RepID=UPI000165C63B|nr:MULTISPECIES: SRPBCC domain-containing protein [Methylobacterium]ACA16781.1 Activator of Hsp90 ATPase 1 family protein [Methylobacterium sp. 4-46]WFT82477.1 SRPBCC domain-containing protein [Methylobacterium nodulans]
MDATPDEAAPQVVASCDIAAAPALVWRALTVPEIVAEWLGPVSPAAGDALRLDLPAAEGGPVACEMLEAVPHERLSYRWRDAFGDSVVTFDLTPGPDGGTHLRVVHRPVAARRAAPARPLALMRPAARPRARTAPRLLRRAA